MKEVEYKDKRGRKFLVRMPDDGNEKEAHMYPVVGPQIDVDSLKIPKALATKLHNQLYERKLFTASDVQKRFDELKAAWQAVLNCDVQAIHAAYQQEESVGG